jgi:hypothetical protein
MALSTKPPIQAAGMPLNQPVPASQPGACVKFEAAERAGLIVVGELGLAAKGLRT